jgi:hypothetical protein
LRSSPHPCRKPAQENFQETFQEASKENFGANFRTKATLESSISRLLLNPNLAKKAAPQDGYLRIRIEPAIAAERKSPACEDAAGIEGRSVEGRRRGGQAILPQEKNKAVGAVYRKRPCQPRTLKSACAAR